VITDLAEYGALADPAWVRLGDRDIATQLVRAGLLAAGHPLSEVTEMLCRRWRPGIRILPATDDQVETHVVPEPGPDGTRGGPIHFQEWWVRHRAAVQASRFDFVGAQTASPAPGVLSAIASADILLLAPSNPVVSIAPILAIPGLRSAIATGAAPVVGISPIIAGAPVRGMADRCLAAIGVECSAPGVGAMFGARSDGGLLDHWLVDEADSSTAVPGVPVTARPLWMTDVLSTAAIVTTALEVARG
jgi:LPPG:FO 2-phospho-L-lactate transferase